MKIEKIERGPDNETVSVIVTLKNVPHLKKDEHLSELYELFFESIPVYILTAYMLAKEGNPDKAYANTIKLIRTIAELSEENLKKDKEE